MINFQKQLIIQQALNDDYSTSAAPALISDNGQNFAASERSAPIANIKLMDNNNMTEDTKASV